MNANCTAAELAEDDLARWITSVDATLPSPVATVAYTAAAATGLPDQFQISLTWQEASEAFSYQTSTFLIPVTP